MGEKGVVETGGRILKDSPFPRLPTGNFLHVACAAPAERQAKTGRIFK